MNVTQLTVFKEVMSTGSVSQAARKLGRTQPAISLSIKNLEESLGLKLFRREGRQLIPVPEAHYLLAEAQDILKRLSTVSRTLQSLRNAEAGSLNISAMPGPSTFLFPRFISRAVGENPNIRVSLSSRSSDQIQELAGTQSIDFGFADHNPRRNVFPQYHEEIIAADCFCAVPFDHPLSQKAVVSCKDLDHVPMGSLHTNHAIYHDTLAAFRTAGATFNKKVESQIYVPLIQFVGASQCCSIVDPLTMVTEREMNATKGTVVFKPMAEKLVYRYVILTPLHRPLSQLAIRLKAGWKSDVLSMLENAGANPVVSNESRVSE